MISNVINEEVKTIASENTRWGDAYFSVSTLLNPVQKSNSDKHKIILSVENNGIIHSRVIFPKENVNDYLSLEDEMEYLYNSTV